MHRKTSSCITVEVPIYDQYMIIKRGFCLARIVSRAPRSTNTSSRAYEGQGHTYNNAERAPNRQPASFSRGATRQNLKFKTPGIKGLSSTDLHTLIKKEILYLKGSTHRLEEISTELGLKNHVSLVRTFSDLINTQGKEIEFGQPNVGALRSLYEASGLTGLRDGIVSQFGLFASFQTLSPEDIADQRRHADMTTPAEWYPLARATPRKLHLHVGPTNSGKTYQALKRLKEAKSGYFAGPLRLLAFEIYDRFNKAGVPCNLSTGDEVRREDNATITASTIEMLNTNEEMDVLVIDEIQMIADADRGSAWTRALLGACAREIHMCGEASVVSLIQEFAKSLGETVEVHNYTRLGTLQPMNESLGGTFQSVQSGDAVVTFSRNNIFDIKKGIEQVTGKKCAVVYGALPPEARAAQARLFNDPNSGFDVLVASDAIGMGLNLSIKRVVFEAMHKWNGKETVVLEIPQIKQIAGRAGRFKAQAKAIDVNDLDPPKDVPGYVTTLRNEDLHILHEALATPTIQLNHALLDPTTEQVERFARPYPSNIRLSMVLQQMNAFAMTSSTYKITDLSKKNAVLDLLHPISGISFRDRWTLSEAPLKLRDPQCVVAFVEMAQYLGTGRRAEVLDLKEIQFDLLDEGVPETQERLSKLESLHVQLTLYLWLAIRFPGTFVSMIEVYQLRKASEEVIESALELMKARKQSTGAGRQFVSRGMLMQNRKQAIPERRARREPFEEESFTPRKSERTFGRR